MRQAKERNQLELQKTAQEHQIEMAKAQHDAALQMRTNRMKSTSE